MAKLTVKDVELKGKKVLKIKKTCHIRCSKTLIGCVFIIMERFTGFSPQFEFLPSLLQMKLTKSRLGQKDFDFRNFFTINS